MCMYMTFHVFDFFNSTASFCLHVKIACRRTFHLPTAEAVFVEKRLHIFSRLTVAQGKMALLVV